MEQDVINWLPHLVNAIPDKGYGKRLSAVTIALEAWRRGLKVEFYAEDNNENKLRIRYKISDGEKTHYFASSMGDKVTEEAFKICDNKYLTKEYLKKNNVPTPEGKMFDENAVDEEIIQYAMKIGFPLVIKPTNANGGRGVFSNLTNTEDLINAVNHVRNEVGYKEIIVEQYVPGVEYRIIVIGDKVIGALNRVPANVIGDGKSTIRELIRKKNKQRKNNPHLKTRMIKIDKEVLDLLYYNEYTLDTIPQSGEVVTLRLTSNLTTGGDSVEITDDLNKRLKSIAIEATKAIPGLALSGIDMIVNDEQNNGSVIEVNTRPGLGGHLFPVKGQARDIPSYIIDDYFPETKNVKRGILYYDFDDVAAPLTSRAIKKVTLEDMPKNYRYTQKLTIQGNFDVRKYRIWLRRTVLNLHLHGFSKLINENVLEVIVCGRNEETIYALKELCYKGPENTNVTIDNIKVEAYEYPVKIGFENIKEVITESQLKELEKEQIQLEHEYARLVKKYSQIKNSRAWRVTYPIRTVLHKLKVAIRRK